MSLGVQRNGPLPGRITETELRAAYQHRQEARRCACGGTVVADPNDPVAGILEHRDTPRHRAWLAWWLAD